MTTNWQGTLKLSFKEQDGYTWLDRSFASAPLKIQRPFYPEGKSCCHLVTLHTAGGLLGGDQLSIKCELNPRARVLITNGSATKVYRSESDFAIQEISLQLAENTVLEWFPQETILFADAKFKQNLFIELGNNALSCGWEINRFGRTARAEKFNDGTWKNHTEIWQGNIPLWIDRQFLTGQGDMLNSYNGLWQKSSIGTFWFVGRSVTKEMIDHLRTLVEKCPDEIAITRLEKGLICRYRGDSTLICRQQFMVIWHYLMVYFTDRLPSTPRVWQM